MRVVVWMRGEEEDGGAAHLANTTDTPRVCVWSVECGVGVSVQAGRERRCVCAVRCGRMAEHACVPSRIIRREYPRLPLYLICRKLHIAYPVVLLRLR